MNCGNRSNVDCIQLEFLKSKSLSQQSKVKEFWKFLDHQDQINPFVPPKMCDCVDEIDKSIDIQPIINKPTEIKSVKPKVKKVKKSKACSYNEDSKYEKYLREDLKYADSFEATYDELNAEIEEYNKRLLEKEKNDCDLKSVIN